MVMDNPNSKEKDLMYKNNAEVNDYIKNNFNLPVDIWLTLWKEWDKSEVEAKLNRLVEIADGKHPHLLSIPSN
jgi:hypothetical protein